MFKFTRYIEYALLAICAVVIVVFYVQSSSGAFALSNLKDLVSSFTMTDGLLYWTYAICAVAVVLVLVMAVLSLVKNPRLLKKAGVVLGAFAVLIVIAFVISSDAEIPANVSEAPTSVMRRLTDFSLLLTYLLCAVTVIALLFGPVINKFKK